MWIQTHSGKKFYPLNPTLSSIDIHDIAAALSKQCRYAGHCRKFYSVAEHCVLMARVATPEHKLAALMHDASEAYLVDIPSPIKPLLIGYKEMESDVMAAIAIKYGFSWPLPPEVKEIDHRILADERSQNMLPMADADAAEWGSELPPLGIALEYWNPEQGHKEFMTAFLLYGGIIH